jgi:hypothetical protein
MQFSIGVGIDKKMSRKEFGEKWKFKMTTKVSSFMKK